MPKKGFMKALKALKFFLSKQNKKNPAHHSVDIGKSEIHAKFQQKILNCRVVGARQGFQIFRQSI